MTVVGLGQPAAGDDGVGIAVIRALGELDGVEVVALRDAAPLVDLLDGRALLLVDAVVGLGSPGSLHWLAPADLARAPLWSTHGLSVPDAMGLAEAIHGPSAAAGLAVLGIAVAPPGGPSMTLSPDVAAAIEPAVAEVRRFLEAHRA